MRFSAQPLLLLFALLGSVSAQFGIFEQMFGGGHHQQQAPQNAASDSDNYRHQVDHTHCDKYLCPDTLGTLPTPTQSRG
jgi:hypothetical protein